MGERERAKPLSEQEVSNKRHSEALARLVAWVEKMPNTERRALAATWLFGELTQTMRAVSAVRNAAIRDLWVEGFSYKEIAELLNVSVQRVSQIVQGE